MKAPDGKVKAQSPGKRAKQFLIIALLVLGALTLVAVAASAYLRSCLFPADYREMVKEIAGDNDIDPLMVAAVIFAESNFDEHAISRKDARGLMQILPETASEIAGKLGKKAFSVNELFDPETNIEFGCFYIAGLVEEFAQDHRLAIAAYNGGQTNVRRWLDESGKEGFAAVEECGFDQTRRYVKKVMIAWRVLRVINSMRKF